MIHHGDCLAILPTLDAESIDAIVTDPPYDLTDSSSFRLGSHPGGSDRRNQTRGFMGKAWDGTGVAFDPETWRLALRVAKPGAYLLAFGGTRTVHRLTSAIEDAGWEIRDMLVWAYASGFPKSHNLTGERQGWGTALKPAWEPIVMARKPLRGTVAANVLAHGTGALNIDGCRIGYTSEADKEAALAGDAFKRRDTSDAGWSRPWMNDPEKVAAINVASKERAQAGRWPANVILTDPIFDGGVEGVVGGGETRAVVGTYRHQADGEWEPVAYMGTQPGSMHFGYGDSGTYSRFFLIPKAARSDREPVLGGGSPRVVGVWGGDGTGLTTGKRATLPRANVHPTVKPTELMRHLVRLVTPPRGIVLDPFLGSGTTALACELEGFGWVGIEREAEYVAIAEARLNGTQRGLGLEATA